MTSNSTEYGQGAVAAASADASVRGVSSSLRASLVGAWALVSCTETDVETGDVFLPMGETPVGFILYTPDGYMSAQLSAPGRANFSDGDMYRGTPDEYTAAGLSYLAYSGPYHVDETHQTIEHGMTVSAFPNWTGERQLRLAELDGDQLTLRTNGPTMFSGSMKDAVIVWRRAAFNA
jgi:hypothetical protein